MGTERVRWNPAYALVKGGIHSIHWGDVMYRSEDLISVLTQDHREMRQLFTELEHLSGGESLRRTLTDQLIVEVVRHSVAEECYLYPVSRELLPGGEQAAEEALTEHNRIEGILRRLAVPDLPDDQFALLLSTMITDTRRHLDDEEERIFPLLAEFVPEEDLVELGKKARNSKACAPSRPSHKANGPLVHQFLKSGSGLVERVRAYLCGHDKAYPGRR
jgi:hemerythrin-like domain-containing protein